jgi:DNA topoisomerase VI subunit B
MTAIANPAQPRRMSAPALERRTFSVSRAADFLEARALVSQTGQPAHRFGDAVVKELLDNALDACETAGVQPEITVTVEADGGIQRVTVTDNGSGLPPDVVTRILDYSTLTSDKALYRSPCRGAQGNALKTIIGIRHALGMAEPVVIEARCSATRWLGTSASRWVGMTGDGKGPADGVGGAW